ncbi:terminal uridylyltransferase 4-like [Patiria miniata]|uniref:PAP-associated domain-containing protein n=1 Tax=Patiria miniata TaxID=46514 RepID=A0A913ZXG1_PATMI|nr:terminal uridylyltransferase 4-like [Patiria miniata]
MAFRYWARLCGLDSQSDGSMPAYSFVLMTIFFLQHCDPPVVPVLQEDETLERQNTDTLGELWIKMLQFYTVDVAVEEMVISVRKREPISREELKIPNRRLVIEDPIAINKKNIAKSLSSNTVFQYLIDRLQQALLYFGKPQKAACTCRSNAVSGSKATKTTNARIDSSKAIQTNRKSSEDTVTKNVDTMNTSIQTTKQCIELDTKDEIANLEQIPIGNTGVSRAIPTISMMSGLSRNLQLPPSKDSTKSVSAKLKGKSGNDSELESACRKSTIGSDSDIEDSLVTDSTEKDGSTSDVDLLDGHLNTARLQNCIVPDKQYCSAGCGDDVMRQQQVKSIVEVDTQTDMSKSEISLCHHHFRYAFNEKILTGGIKVVVICNGCGKEGHKVAVSICSFS